MTHLLFFYIQSCFDFIHVPFFIFILQSEERERGRTGGEVDSFIRRNVGGDHLLDLVAGSKG